MFLGKTAQRTSRFIEYGVEMNWVHHLWQEHELSRSAILPVFGPGQQSEEIGTRGQGIEVDFELVSTRAERISIEHGRNPTSTDIKYTQSHLCRRWQIESYDR